MNSTKSDSQGQTPDSLAEHLISRLLSAGKDNKANFYILGTDTDQGAETTIEQMTWRIEDLKENRPAMSHVMDEYKAEFTQRREAAKSRTSKL